jgi:hypothetical protein
MPDTAKHPTALGAADFDSPVSYAIVPAGVRFTGNNIDGTKHFNVTGPGTIDIIAQGVTPLTACYRVRLDHVYKAPNVRNVSAIFNPDTSTIDITWTLPDLSSVKRQSIQSYQIYPRSSNKIIEEIPRMQIGTYVTGRNNGNSVGSAKVIASEVTSIKIQILIQNLYFPYVSIKTNYGGMSSPELYIPVIAPPSYKVPEYGLKPTAKLDYIPDDSVMSGRMPDIFWVPYDKDSKVGNSNTGGRIYIGGANGLGAMLLDSDGKLIRNTTTGNPVHYNLDSDNFQIDIDPGINTVIFFRRVANTGSGSGTSQPYSIQPYPYSLGYSASHSIIIP